VCAGMRLEFGDYDAQEGGWGGAGVQCLRCISVLLARLGKGKGEGWVP